jgi:adenylosuccinate lyase
MEILTSSVGESMNLTPLTALSPVDGRYASKLEKLRLELSESGLIARRIRLEAAWLLYLAPRVEHSALAAIPERVASLLAQLASAPPADAAEKVKALERTTNHDVKAVEYYVREILRAAHADPKVLEYVHFGCTSEDINNLSYALMLRDARANVYLTSLDALIAKLRELAHTHAAVAMLSRTHGQPASPTTLGKEVANFVARLQRLRAACANVEILGKFNGATGNYNAHRVAHPNLDWLALSRGFVQSLGLTWNEYTTQIEPHDWMAELFDVIARTNTVMINLCRDIWGYISLGYFRQHPVDGEVGSSTMPHKVNPIDFENAEGNLGIANALLRHFAEKLPISRWQRDLTDSTVLRNVGVAFGHTLIAHASLAKGLAKLEVNHAVIAADLDDAWEVLTEALQTVMRAHGVPDAYEQLKKLARGHEVSRDGLLKFVDGLALPDEVRRQLKELTPATYIGFAETLARRV